MFKPLSDIAGAINEQDRVLIRHQMASRTRPTRGLHAYVNGLLGGHSPVLTFAVINEIVAP